MHSKSTNPFKIFIFVFLVFFSLGAAWSANLEIHVVNVGQGDCLLIISPDNKTLLLDAGNTGKGNNTVYPYLQTLGYSRLDYIVASHYDADHIGGIDEVVENLGGHSYINSAIYDRGSSKNPITNAFTDYVLAAGSKRITIEPGDIIYLGSEVTLTCIAAGGKTSTETVYSGTTDENLLGVVLRLDYCDFQMVLGGDVEERIEEATGSLVGNVDVYKVHHHGSKNASCQSFLDEILPEVATIHVGNNAYDHPSTITHNSLYNMGCYIYQTENGDNPPTSAQGEVANGHFKIVTNGCSYTVSGSSLTTAVYDTDGSEDCPCNGEEPVIEINRDNLYFGAVGGTVTGSQTLFIRNSGSGTLNWSISTNQTWLNASPTSGSGPGTVTVSVNTSGLSAGTRTGTITVSDPNAANSPRTVTVTLKIYNTGSNAAPFGQFATPLPNTTVSGSIPVTGWVVDDIEVKSVTIYSGSNPIGDAIFVEGARPDIVTQHPGYPMNYKAGWGYMLLTNFLPNGGNGPYTLYAIATDVEGNETILGSRDITVDNANAVKPFGAIESPAQGGTATGSKYTNWGWALTPPPNYIPRDGSTIEVWVDSVKIGNPTYDLYRSDIAQKFPTYLNSDGALGFFTLDTTPYANGVHTIQWTATDSDGNTGGIGSRYFTIQNTGNRTGSRQQATGNSTGAPVWAPTHAGRPTTKIHGDILRHIPQDNTTPLEIIKGFDNHHPEQAYPDETGITKIKIKETHRLQIHLFPNSTFNIQNSKFSGYSVVNGEFRRLPIGSTLDREQGIFHWQPGPGFYGEYRFIFIHQNAAHSIRKELIIHITPRFD